ncbi:MAG: hypothetical protein HZB92_06175 [Euryarchaeota archaeon]|nr:hypothetical protein [Euryarchaeota archaeon]
MVLFIYSFIPTRKRQEIRFTGTKINFSPRSIGNTEGLILDVNRIVKIFPQLSMQSIKNLIDDMKKEKVEFYNKEKIIDVTDGMTYWTNVYNYLEKSFIIVDESNNYYFISRDFNKIDEIIARIVKLSGCGILSEYRQ